METNFDIVDAENGFKINGTEFPLTSPITKTIGTGKDFATLRLALDWLDTVSATGKGSVIFTLDDGTHSMGEPSDFDDWNWTYANINVPTSFQAAGGVAANCIVTLPSTDDGDNYPPYFSITTFCNFSDMSFSSGAGSYPYPSHASFCYVIGGGQIQMNNCVVEDFDDGVYINGGAYGAVVEYSGKGFTIDNCVRGVACFNGAFVHIDSGVVISNCTTGIACSLGGRVYSKATMTTNTADQTGTINVIEYDGSHVTNGTSAMSFKA